jgi:hypothetical protein
MANVLTPPPTGDSPTNKLPPTKKRDSDATPDGKPKRTRTGCLTCRERHLKCDESKPTCINCSKSQRGCNWGKKLNFLDTTCERNAYLIPQGIDYQIAFQDESRIIASEYVGGREMYPAEEVESHLSMGGNGFGMGPPGALGPSVSSRQHIPSMQGPGPYPAIQHGYDFDHQRAPPPQHGRTRKSSWNSAVLHSS